MIDSVPPEPQPAMPEPEAITTQLLTLYQAVAERCGVPKHLRDGLALYVVLGLRTGSFLQAVLSDRFLDAFKLADEESSHGMAELVQFVYGETPNECHGSEQAYADWTERGGIVGKRKP